MNCFELVEVRPQNLEIRLENNMETIFFVRKKVIKIMIKGKRDRICYFHEIPNVTL